ncbi:MAG: MarR family winged helix-turn-helix transcriptional regulator [Steroidobacteraceae bacterium]
MTARTQLSHEEYRTLSEFRYLIRHFLEFSEMGAAKSGLTTRQHQALLMIKSFPRDDHPTVGEIAERLCIQHHSAVELADRMVKCGLILRGHDADDRRLVRLSLTS